MKFLVAVDLEGVACAVAPYAGSVEDAFNIEFVRRQATREANAAAVALFEAGATTVTVWDNHGRGCSLEVDGLDPRCEIALGSTVYTRYPGLDESYSGVLLVGYHAMEGTRDATLAHSYSSSAYCGIRINGAEYGEIGIDAMIAGELGVPVIFVSSDDKGAAEAAALLPWAAVVTTKRSLAYTRVVSKHPAAVVRETGEGVRRAVAGLKAMRPLPQPPGPLTLELRFKTQALAAAARLIDAEGRPFAMPDAYTRRGPVRDAASLVHYL